MRAATYLRAATCGPQHGPQHADRNMGRNWRAATGGPPLAGRNRGRNRRGRNGRAACAKPRRGPPCPVAGKESADADRPRARAYHQPEGASRGAGVVPPGARPAPVPLGPKQGGPTRVGARRARALRGPGRPSAAGPAFEASEAASV